MLIIHRLSPAPSRALLAVIVLMLAAGAVLAADQNIVSNGAFDQGQANWWGPGFEKDAAKVIKEGAPPGAPACLKISSEWICQDKIPIEAGKRYSISMQIRSDGAPDGSVYAQISYRGSGIAIAWHGPAQADTGGGKEKALFVTGSTHPWKSFAAVVSPPKGANQLLIYLRKRPGSAGTADCADVKAAATEGAETTAGELKRGDLAAKLLSPALPPAQAATAIKSLLAAGAQPTPARLNLIENGAIKYQTLVGAHADLLTLNAARELNEYLGRISGSATPELSHDEHPGAGSLLIVGRDNALTPKLCPDIPYAELGEDGFVIRTVGPHIVIAGATPGATMYGVNWLLDRKLGVKWLSPDYTYTPSSKALAVAPVNEKQIPRFKFRQILSVEGQDKPFAAHNLLNGNSHGAYGIISPPEIDHWNNSWQRPGLTASFNDLTSPKYQAGGQVLMMNPEARQAIAEAVIKRLKGVPNYKDYWFGLMDNDWGWDMDEHSAGFAKAHGDAPSAAKLDLAIDVLKRVRQILPEAKIAFNAYHWGFTPPTGMTVPEGLLVYPMDIHMNYSAPLNEGRNVKLGRDLEGWNAISKDILMWDHVVNFNGYIQPTPNIYPICKSIRWLATLPNFHGYFAEGSWNTRGAEFASLRAWIMARMLWAPATDYQAAIGEYCAQYYGAAAGLLIKQYIDLMHETSLKSGAQLREKTNVDSAMFTLQFVCKADALLAEAEALAADNPAYIRHVRQARIVVDYVILLRRAEYAAAITAAPQSAPFNLDVANRLARFNQTVKEEKITQYRQDGSTKELADVMALERKLPQPPEIARGLPPSDWVAIQDLGFNRYYAQTVIAPDDTASDGTAARLPGNLGAWVIQCQRNKLPEQGLWDLYVAARVDADSAANNDIALVVGSAPPMNRSVNVTVGELKKGAYTFIKVPGGPFRYDNDIMSCAYVHGTDSKKIKYIYVDRFVAIRVADKAAK